MKTYNFIVFLNDDDVASIEINAKTEQEAWNMIEQIYPTYKGYSHQIYG